MRVCFRPIGYTGPSSISFLFLTLSISKSVYLLYRTIVDSPYSKSDNIYIRGDVES